jgi:nucleoside-diphosphate-sugar epimerase
MNILITGASGLIGSTLTNRLNKEGHKVFGQSRSTQPVCDEITWVEHDLVSSDWSTLELPQIDAVYHLAAQTSAYFSQASPIADFRINVVGFLNMLEHFRNQKVPPFVIFPGTATQFGMPATLPVTESFPDHPMSFYDTSKCVSEIYLKQYINSGLITGCCLRLPNVLGRSKREHGSVDRGILDKVYLRALSGQDIPMYGTGEYRRDYLYIDDVVEALVVALKCKNVTNGRMYCLGSGEGVKLKNAFEKVIFAAQSHTQKKVDLKIVAPPEHILDIDYRDIVIDASAFRNDTGWKPKFNFDQSILKLYGSFY